ncbi:MAG: Alkyl hydroperoxide reductase [Patescibacteria group bacterium]|jgi:alkyl hydroperoxide reductase subunit F|nr:Alkyl hydroperoxide reductase [Patescibacteria group bacterium]
MFDLAIIGGGPAGVAAGVYAARKRLTTVFIAEHIGGQSTDSVGIENWIGTEKISGVELAKSLERHLRAYAGDMVELHIGERAEKAEKIEKGFSIHTQKGTYEARAVLIASGGSRRKLEIPGAAEFENKGLTYCASCDGPLFSGQDVVVVGGGNAGFESAAQLLAYCKSVTLIHRNEVFDKADASTVEAVLKHPNMRVLRSSEPVEVKGSGFVSSVMVKSRSTSEVTEVPAAGVFVEIGMIPSTTYAKDIVTLDPLGRVPVDAKNQRTSTSGVWSAGDCTDELYHQNNIAAGDAVKALEDIYYWLKSHS